MNSRNLRSSPANTWHSLGSGTFGLKRAFPRIVMLLETHHLPTSQATQTPADDGLQTGSSFLLSVVLGIYVLGESALILKYHPSTLLHPHDVFSLVDVPGWWQMAMQIGVCLAIEFLLELVAIRFIKFSQGNKEEEAVEGGKEQDPAAFLACNIVRSVATLLVAVALLSGPSLLTDFVGQIHAIPVVWWALLQQGFDWTRISG